MSWWKSSVVYQIYPRSFQDSTGDGVGDLRGITSRLDHLSELGADVVWLCPVYDSPNDDGGYDIRDYRAILPEFGTLADWDELLSEMHRRGIRLIMDLVVNHTSDEHPWFVEARKGKTLPDGSPNPYRDYYIWRPAREDGSEPSNWGSHFGGSAWKWDEASGEYFLHLFSERQPDLNWENPAVRREVYAMMRWWLDRGIDGFRMDTINMLSKAPGFPDAPRKAQERYPLAELHFLNGPRLFEYLREMRREVLDHYDTLTVGETPGVSPEGGVEYTRTGDGVLSMIFQFDHMALDKDASSPTPRWTQVPYRLAELKQVTERWQHALHGQGWNSLYLSNHDVPRLVSRFGDDGEFRVPSAKLLATFLHTLQGTPYVYQGDEIGMTNVQFASISEYRDVDALNLWHEEVVDGGGRPEDTLRRIWAQGRDNARTPMQWSGEPGAGFTTGTPWIGLNPNFREVNVEADKARPDSVFRYTQALIALRREHPVIVEGDFRLLLPEHEQVFAYTRRAGEQTLLVLLNFSGHGAAVAWPTEEGDFRLLLGNLPDAPEEGGADVTLLPWEARVYLAG